MDAPLAKLFLAISHLPRLDAWRIKALESAFMVPSRSLNRDLLGVGILAALAYLLVALGTYDPADPVARLIAPLDQIYQPDTSVYPLNEEPRNACGRFGALVADLLFATFGLGAFYVLIGLAVLAVAMLIRGQLNSIWVRTLGWVLSLIGLTGIFHRVLYSSITSPMIGPGGSLGALCSGLLQSNFGPAGSLIVMITLTLIGTMFWTDYFVFRMLRLAFAPLVTGAELARRNQALKIGSIGSRNAGLSERPTAMSTRDGLAAIPVRSATLRDDLSLVARPSLVESLAAKKQIGKNLAATVAVKADEFGDLDEADQFDRDARNDSEDSLDQLDDAADADIAAPSSVVITKQNAAKAATTKASKPADERQQVIHALNHASLGEQPAAFELPSIDLLDLPVAVNFDEHREDALRKARILEKTFQQFGFNVKVVDIETGPVIAQYELELEAGLRLAKITNLSDDLAIALRVPSVRIVASIPGKNTVGIEVPNETRQTVRLREVMERGAAKAAKMKIPLFVGQDVRGDPLVVDLASLPHLLIAGRTGTGKSVCLNAIIASILMTRRPDEVRMLMIDPKMVELSGYARLPHLMHPVVTDMRKAEAILAWAVDKMEERYALLARAGVRHITSYNQLGEQELINRLQPETEDERSGIPLSLPFIVIVADEMADLMMTAGKEVQQHIIRLAQKSRAVGIHLILATQKPTVDVITGLIKSNLPARIAFQVATRTDSQVVLDCNGAERLLGNGDMLFLWPGTSTLLRGQGTYLTDEEITAVTNSVSTGEQNFVHELVNMRVADPSQVEDESANTLKNRDEVYQQAVEVVIREGRGSVSLLQRALGIGYGRAARLIDFMEQDGIVGAYAGSKSRDVVMALSQWHQMQDAARSDTTDATPKSKLIVSPLVAKLRPPTRLADPEDIENESDDVWDEDESEDERDESPDVDNDEELDSTGEDNDGVADEDEDNETGEARARLKLARPSHFGRSRSQTTADGDGE